MINPNTTIGNDKDSDHSVPTLQTTLPTTIVKTTLSDVEEIETIVQTSTKHNIGVELPLELTTWYVSHYVQYRVCVCTRLCVCVWCID